MVKDATTSEQDLKPTPIRLKEWHRAKAESRIKELDLKSLAHYIRHLIEKDL